MATSVMLGHEHCVANMFFIPCAMMYGANISVMEFTFQNLLPVTLGNLVGAQLIMGIFYTYVIKKSVKSKLM
jgi:formate/nitrite transporter FocA (FNT family)